VNFNDKYFDSRGRATLFIAGFFRFKNASNEPNFIDFGGGNAKPLRVEKNYHF